LLFDLLLLKCESILVPDEIRLLGVESVTLHAAFEEADNVRIVRILSKAQSSAVVHEFTEFFRLVLAQFLYGHLFLLFLDIGVLLLLGSSWESLPWKSSL
jgi:hypothetical protein